MKKEWGGYIPLEFTLEYNNRNELFCDIDIRHIVQLNSARNAICMLMKTKMYNKIWIPLYMCLSIKESLEKYGISYEEYNINEHFRPIVDSIPDDDIILICNYFGLQDESIYADSVRRYRNVVFDNTQAFFCKPLMANNVFNVYSPRKFVGISDGAFLIGMDIDRDNGIFKQIIDQLPVDSSYERCGYLTKCVELTTNDGYESYLDSENQLGDDIKLMSPLTGTMIRGINLREVKRIRNMNFYIAKSKLDKYNELSIDDSDSAPMCYPLLFSRDDLREKLVAQRIYVPQWWKWVVNDAKSNEWEKKVSKRLCPVPIDQRYTAEDICELTDMIIRLISG